MPYTASTTRSNPRQIKVQLNVKVAWEFREFLSQQAALGHVSLNSLVAEALLEQFPDFVPTTPEPDRHPEVTAVRRETTNAGATR